jgi:hypothetical protein
LNLNFSLNHWHSIIVQLLFFQFKLWIQVLRMGTHEKKEWANRRRNRSIDEKNQLFFVRTWLMQTIGAQLLFLQLSIFLMSGAMRVLIRMNGTLFLAETNNEQKTSNFGLASAWSRGILKSDNCDANLAVAILRPYRIYW